MKEIRLGTILAKRQKTRGEEAVLVERYLERARRFVACGSSVFDSEEAFFQAAERGPGRPAAYVMVFDGRGQMLTSEEFARRLQRVRDEGAQRVMLGIGPADGWTEAARARAGEVISFGRMTLPHELAQVVAAEQIYRALTILAGHPYHGGH